MDIVNAESPNVCNCFLVKLNEENGPSTGASYITVVVLLIRFVSYQIACNELGSKHRNGFSNSASF